MSLILLLSVALRVTALTGVLFQWFTSRRVSAALLTMLLVALLGQQIFLFPETSFLALIMDLCVSASLLAFVVSRKPVSRTEGSEGQLPVRKSRLVMTALGMTALAMTGMLVTGWQAYSNSRAAVMDSVAQDSLAVCHSLVMQAERALEDQPPDDQLQDRAIELLARIWKDTQPWHPGSYLCVIDGQGTLALHTMKPEIQGMDVSSIVVDPHAEQPRTISVLLAHRANLATRNTNLGGEQQLCGYGYMASINGLAVVHVPARLVEDRILQTAAPWIVALFVIGGVMFPLSVGLIHVVCRKSEREALLNSQALHRNEQLLRDQFAELDLLYHTAPVGLCLVNTDLRFLRINEELASINGLPVEAHIGRTVQEVLPDIADDIEPIFREVISSGRPRLDLDVVRVDPADPERRCYYLASYFPLTDDDGKVRGIGTLVQDITRRVRAEEKLRLTNFSVDSCSTSIFWIRQDASFFYVNKATSSLLGYTPEELLDMRVWDIDPDYPREVWPDFWQSIEQEKSLNFESLIRHKDGTLVPVEITTNLLEFNGDEFVFAFVTDITDRKRDQRALRESEQRWSFALDGSRDGVWDWNADTGEVFFSRRWKDMLGFTDHEIGSDQDEWESRVHPHDRQRCLNDLQRHLAGITPHYENEYRMQCRDGSWKWFLDRGKVISRSPSNQPLRVIGTHTDITERKLAEQEIRQHRDMLAHVTRISTMGELVAGIAHEVNQPLHAIANFATAAAIALRDAESAAPGNSDLVDELKEWNQGIRDASLRASQIIKRLREFSRKGTRERVAVDINEIVTASIELVAFEARDCEISVETDLASDLPLALADRIQCEQVMVNLLHNACEALANSELPRNILVHTRRCDGMIELQVADNGPGIPPEEHPRLFEPFYTTKSTGMGLGLAISRTIIEDHDGRLWASDNHHLGTTFHFTLPTAVYPGCKEALA